MSRVVEIWMVAYCYPDGSVSAFADADREDALQRAANLIREAMEAESYEETELEIALMQRMIQTFKGYSNGWGQRMTLHKQFVVIPEPQMA